MERAAARAQGRCDTIVGHDIIIIIVIIIIVVVDVVVVVVVVVFFFFFFVFAVHNNNNNNSNSDRGNVCAVVVVDQGAAGQNDFVGRHRCASRRRRARATPTSRVVAVLRMRHASVARARSDLRVKNT